MYIKSKKIWTSFDLSFFLLQCNSGHQTSLMSEINWTVFDFMQPRNWVECLLEPACGGISFFFRSMNLSKSSCEFPNYEWTLNYFCERDMVKTLLLEKNTLKALIRSMVFFKHIKEQPLTLNVLCLL